MSGDPKTNERQFDLLDDPTSCRLVGLLALRARRAVQLAPLVGLERAATARWLRRLVAGGLVRALPSPVVSRSVRYGLDPAAHGAITAWLAGLDPSTGDPRRDGFETSGAPASRAGAPNEWDPAVGRRVRRRSTGGTRGPPR